MNSSIASGIDSCLSPAHVLKLSVTLPEGTIMTDSEAIEAIRLFSTLRRAEGLPAGDFSASHVSEIHGHLFDIIGPFAGKYRQSDAGTGHISPERIEASMQVWQHDLANDPIMKSTELTESFIHTRIAHFSARLLQIRPFEVGNGLLVRCFIEEMIKAHGMLVDWSKTSANSWSLAVGSALHDGDFSSLVDVLSSTSVSLADDEGQNKANTLEILRERAPTFYALLKRELQMSGHLAVDLPADFDKPTNTNSTTNQSSMGP